MSQLHVNWVYKALYPSTQKPGIFPHSQSLNEQGDDTAGPRWDELNGIGEEELNTFKFSLGTWTQFLRRNRQIKLTTPAEAHALQPEIASDSAPVPKPNYIPDGFPGDLYEWAIGNMDMIVDENDGSYDHGEDIRAELQDQMGGIGDDKTQKRWSDANNAYIVRYYVKSATGQPDVYANWKTGKTTGTAEHKWDGDDEEVEEGTYDDYWEVYYHKKDTSGINEYFVYFRPNIKSDAFNNKDGDGIWNGRGE